MIGFIVIATITLLTPGPDGKMCEDPGAAVTKCQEVVLRSIKPFETMAECQAEVVDANRRINLEMREQLPDQKFVLITKCKDLSKEV